MGMIKKVERSSKRSLMRLIGRLIRCRRITTDEFREMEFHKILVIRQHNQMGDMILAVPAFRALKHRYPNAGIGVICSTLNRDVLANNPYIDRLFLYDKKDPLSHARLVRDIRRERYDIVIVLHTVSFSFTSLVLALLSRAPVRIGSTSRDLGDSLTGSYLNLTLPLPTETQLSEMNEAEHNLYPLSAIGITTDDLSPLIVPSAENDAFAGEFERVHWEAGKVKLAVHPGAGKTENIWRPRRFAEVVNQLDEIEAITLAVIQGPRDAPAVAEFRAACRVEASIVQGRRIGDVAALMKRADLVLCNDTGVMHVAAAAGATTLAVFGPTDPGRWAPRCAGLHVIRPPSGRLEDLGVERVVQSAVGVLGLVPRAQLDS